MSEAFANRHHHCEDMDGLNRGIWTWHGPGGTADRPTGPATKMYLKCNHDGCGRIDWRTVHGLQCHIVKNHEQQKGTIGSLEKALAAYGVPVAEIEDYENRHGIGTCGTMADPKSIKLRAAKQKEASERKDQSGRQSTPVTNTTPSKVSQNPAFIETNSSSVHASQNLPQNDRSGPAATLINVDEHSRPVPSGFAAINCMPPQNIRPASSQSIAHLVSPQNDEKQPDPPSLTSKEAPDTFWSNWKASSMPSTPKTPKSGREEKIVAGYPQIQPKQTRDILPVQAEPRSGSRVTDPAVQKFIDATIAKGPEDNNKPIMVDPEQTDVEVKEPQEMEQRPLTSEEAPQAQAQPADITADTLTEAQPTKDESISPIQQPGAHKPRAKTPELLKQDDSAIPSTPTAPESNPLRSAMQSPEIANRRIVPPRRTSRRASIAIANSMKAARELLDGEMDVTPGTTTASKTTSIADEEHDSITVNTEAREAMRAEKERENDEDRSKTTTPARRLANGRFSKRSR